MITTTTALEIDGLKTRLKETWMAGDYDRFSRYMEQGARIFYEQLDIPAGCQLLDVACGSGQVALWAARDGVNVTGVDIAPNLIQRAQARAKAEGLNARFMEGDAEELPFEDGSFDVVISLVGAMFAPRPGTRGPRGAASVQSRRDHRHGKLDARRIRGTNVQYLRQVHRSLGHAGSGVVGR
jgi:SAM-dependent methyltransferase